MALNVDRIIRALADQIRAHVPETVTVSPWSAPETVTYPRLAVIPDPDFIDYLATYTASGLSNLRCRVRIETNADSPESLFVQVAGFLSAGNGETSSIPDAVMIDKTLGGVVQDAVVLRAEWPDAELEPHIAYVTVDIMAQREGAQV